MAVSHVMTAVQYTDTPSRRRDQGLLGSDAPRGTELQPVDSPDTMATRVPSLGHEMPDLPQTYDELLDLLPEEGLTAIDRRRTRRLLAARAALTEAEAELVVAVREAYDAGDSWSTIGTVLGISRQSAQRRFASHGVGEEGRLARREEREREQEPEPERSDGRESTA